MKLIAAYLLAVIGGNQNPDAAAVKAILSSVGVEADQARLQQLVDSLKGKNVFEVIKEGNSKLASLSVGSGAAAPAATTAAPAAAADKGKKEEKKKEEPKEEEEVDMGLRYESKSFKTEFEDFLTHFFPSLFFLLPLFICLQLVRLKSFPISFLFHFIFLIQKITNFWSLAIFSILPMWCRGRWHTFPTNP
jgi:large subunit ribosomal protein LP2